MVEKPLEVSNVDSKILQPNVEIFGPVTHDQLKKIIDKPKLEASNVDSKPNVGFFEPVTQDPIYNWIWADVQGGFQMKLYQYSSPPQLHYPQLHYFHSYTILN